MANLDTGNEGSIILSIIFYSLKLKIIRVDQVALLYIMV